MSTSSRLSLALYRLQSRAGLTGPEARAAVVLVLALAGGLAAQALRSAETPAAPDFYAAADAAVVQTAHRDSAAVDSARAALPVTPVTADSAALPPSARAAADAVVVRPPGPSPAHPVNVNTATPAELVALPGVGAVTATRIAEARPFRNLADLEARVRGIGPAKASRLAPLVRF